MKSIVSFLLLISVSFGTEIRLKNNCKFTVWPGLEGSTNSGNPENGGFILESGKEHTVQVDKNWIGRIWGRTNCDSKGHCETGDCGDKIECDGAVGTPPVSLAEISLGVFDTDFYDISLVDGFNLPISIAPIGEQKAENECEAAECSADVNSVCPPDQAVANEDGVTVGCKNTCQDACQNSVFKKNCPNAYVYPLDESQSTFACSGNSQRNYEVVFCP